MQIVLVPPVPPASPGARRHWRLYITAAAGSNPYPGFSEIELRSSAGGSDLTGSGTASASHTEGGHSPADVVDNSTSTFWATYPGTPPVWWAYDFGSGVAHDIVELRITPRTDAYTADGPGTFQFQYSDDGSTWTTVSTVSGLTWPSTAAQTITITPTGTPGLYGVLSDAPVERLVLVSPLFVAGAATYTRLLLDGASLYGVTGGAGALRTELGGIGAEGDGGVPGGGGRWFQANEVIYMYRKNTTGQSLAFVLLDSTTGAALTGATVSGYRSVDGGTQAAVTGTISEKANGQYSLALSAADCNGNQIGYLFTATGAVPVHLAITTSSDLLADIWSQAIETGWSALESMRVMLSALAGKVSGANTTSIAFRDVTDTKSRISATVDQYGNRTVVGYDKT